MRHWLRILLLSVFVLAQMAGAGQAHAPVPAPDAPAAMAHAPGGAGACDDCGPGSAAHPPATCQACQLICVGMTQAAPALVVLGAVAGEAHARPRADRQPGQTDLCPPGRPPSAA